MGDGGGGVLELERIGTGHAATDAILSGGFPTHSINIIMGQPGAGKTILAEQLLFHNATGDRPVVYITTLAEPLAKVLTYLQTFRFYDEEKMLGSVVYQDVSEELLGKGIDFLVEHVGSLIRELRPKMLVVDSFKALHDLTESPVEVRRLVARLGGVLSGYDITTFLVGEYASEDVPVYPEFAVADGIVQLARQGSAKNDERYFRVLKLRGSSYQEGLHAFVITPDGLQVFPRLVTPHEPTPYSAEPERIPSGIAGLDPLLDGGLWRGSAALVLGEAGAGKTTFGLGFALEGVRQGEPALVLNLQENPTQLARTVRALGVDLHEYSERGLHFQYQSPVELRIDSVVVELFAAIRARGIRRLVVDALGDLRLAAGSDERFHDYLYSIVQRLAVEGVTSVFTLEATRPPMSMRIGSQEARLSTLSDSLISLHTDMTAEPPERRLRIVKARGSDHSLASHRFTIGPGGIRVEDDERPGGAAAVSGRDPDPGTAAALERLTAVSRALTYAASLDEVLDITVETAQTLLGRRESCSCFRTTMASSISVPRAASSRTWWSGSASRSTRPSSPGSAPSSTMGPSSGFWASRWW